MGQAAGSQEAVWTYTERDGNPNPHKPGEFFKNRYLSKVEVGGSLDPSLAGQQQLPVAQGGGANRGGGRPASETRSIERQAVVKAAISLYPESLITTDEQWFALVERIHAWVAEEKAAVPPKPQAQTVAEAGQADPDDIPFAWIDNYGKEPTWVERWRQ